MLDYNKVPVSYMVGATKRYIEQGIPPGDFLTSVICNDLTLAVQHADRENLLHIADWVSFFYWEVPEPAWGSSERMLAWMEQRQAELSANHCCVCGESTENESDNYGDIYCSVDCYRCDGGQVECPDCGQVDCQCLAELFG